jgi:hypothetical protein
VLSRASRAPRGRPPKLVRQRRARRSARP